MSYNGSTAGGHVNIQLRSPGLPDDEQARNKVLDELATAVETVLAEHGVGEDCLRIFDGHIYSMVSDDCPVCGDQLKLIEPELDSSNGAQANASCECGWYGTATYRLIDLTEKISDQDLGSDCEESPVFDCESCVRLHGITPSYTPY